MKKRCLTQLNTLQLRT